MYVIHIIHMINSYTVTVFICLSYFYYFILFIEIFIYILHTYMYIQSNLLIFPVRFQIFTFCLEE